MFILSLQNEEYAPGVQRSNYSLYKVPVYENDEPYSCQGSSELPEKTEWLITI